MSTTDRPSFDASSRRFLMRRREFLTLGSTAVVGAMATNLPAAVARAVDGRGNATQLSIGFWDGPVRATNAPASLRAPISAEALPVGDPRFISGGARVSVLGFWRGEGRRTPISVSVGVWHDVAGVGRTPVVLWTSDGGHSRLVVPVDSTGALELSINATARPVHTPGNRIAERDTLPLVTSYDESLSAGELVALKLNFDGGSKLRPGVYIVALQEKGASAPAWSSLNVADLTDAESLKGRGPLTQSHLFSRSAPDFDYLLLNVELGSPSTPAR